jgi:hypothetical protein
MIATRVLSEAQIFAELRRLGFEPTGRKTATGEFWLHKTTKRHLQVPFSIQGFFPDWLIWEFEAKMWGICSLPAAKFRVIDGGKNKRRRSPSEKPPSKSK